MAEISRLATAREWEEAWSLLVVLRPQLARDRFLASRGSLTEKGYELFGLRANGELASVASLLIHPHPVRGVEGRVVDLVTSKTRRSEGLGKQLLAFVEQYAIERGCARLYLHTQRDRPATRRFYERHAGWTQRAVVYEKQL